MRKKSLLIVFAVLATLLSACSSLAGSSLQVNDIWARPGLAEGNSAVYFMIDNSTGAEDKLLSASSDVAQAVELHMSMMDDGVMHMMQQHEVPLPAGKTEFKPGGLHVMLIGLNGDLSPGDSFDLLLNFESAGEENFTVIVKEP